MPSPYLPTLRSRLVHPTRLTPPGPRFLGPCCCFFLLFLCTGCSSSLLVTSSGSGWELTSESVMDLERQTAAVALCIGVEGHCVAGRAAHACVQHKAAHTRLCTLCSFSSMVLCLLFKHDESCCKHTLCLCCYAAAAPGLLLQLLLSGNERWYQLTHKYTPQPYPRCPDSVLDSTVECLMVVSSCSCCCSQPPVA
jgi:hypothetical protein